MKLSKELLQWRKQILRKIPLTDDEDITISAWWLELKLFELGELIDKIILLEAEVKEWKKTARLQNAALETVKK